jgi:hypothetical protein
LKGVLFELYRYFAPLFGGFYRNISGPMPNQQILIFLMLT